MKLLVVLALIAVVAARPENDYSRYENFNIEEITGNIRLLEANAKCFTNTGKCTPEGKDIKEWIPESIQSNCGKCSDRQKKLVALVIKAIIEQLPKEWAKLKAMHDPDNKYQEALDKFIAEYAN